MRRFNLYDVSQFILGHIFYRLYSFNPKLIPRFLREQFYRRLNFRNCQNECMFECQKCGCSIPEVLFAPKACKGYMYPAIIWNPKKWYQLSTEIHNREISNMELAKQDVMKQIPNLNPDDLYKFLITMPTFYGCYYLVRPSVLKVEKHQSPDYYKPIPETGYFTVTSDLNHVD